MLTAAETPSALTVAPRPGRLARWLRRAWAHPRPSAEEAWLRDTADLADLEQRLRRLERGRPDRFGPLPALPL